MICGKVRSLHAWTVKGVATVPKPKNIFRADRAVTVDLNLWRVYRSIDGHRASESLVKEAGSHQRIMATNATGTIMGSSGGAHTQHHDQDLLVFMLCGLMFGTALLQIMTIPAFECLQYTVCVYIVGIIMRLVVETGVFDDHFEMLTHSYKSWESIDPHLLLFIFLPALLCGDAMTIDTHVALRCSKQCLLLAGPGVVIGAFATAGATYLVYDWDFWVCLTVGSILAATDPVAVVGLLKDLGASPLLTLLIQGESLMNDGTAIVLFTVAYDIAGGEDYDVSKVIIFLLKSILGAVFVGSIVGGVAYKWIESANDKLDHKSAIIQVMVTLLCSYWSFVLSEGVFHMSGVLSVVSSALVLAHLMWPCLSHREGMLETWHVIEMFGNTLVFFLSGTLTGKAMLVVEMADYFNAFLCYIFICLIRLCMLICFRPILNCLGQPIRMRDIIVMSWGGLRGMVGMALAIVVVNDRFNDHLSSKEAERILFLVSMIALCTLLINAPTAPALCRVLGIMSTPEGRDVLVRNVAKRAKSHVMSEMDAFLTNMQLSRSCAPGIVKEMVKFLMEGVDHHLPGNSHDEEVHDEAQVVAAQALKRGASLIEKGSFPLAQFPDLLQLARLPSFHEPIEVEELWRKFDEGKQQLLNSGAAVTAFQFGKEMESIRKILMEQTVDKNQLQVVREVFLEAVRANYWEALQKGWLVAGTPEPKILFHSVDVAKDSCGSRLLDWEILEKYVNIVGETRNPTSALTSRSTSLISADVQHCMSSSSCNSSAETGFFPRITQKVKELCFGSDEKRQVAVQTRAVQLVENFISAHYKAQGQIASYFGDDQRVDTAEEAFVILESQAQVFTAAASRAKFGKRLRARLCTMWEVEQLADSYHKFVLDVHRSGVLTAKEAEALLHPLHAGMRQLHRERKNHFKALQDSLYDDTPLNRAVLRCLSQSEAAGRIQRRFRTWCSENPSRSSSKHSIQDGSTPVNLPGQPDPDKLEQETCNRGSTSLFEKEMETDRKSVK